MERIMRGRISFQAHFGPQMLNAVKSYVKITMIVNIGLGFCQMKMMVAMAHVI